MNRRPVCPLPMDGPLPVPRRAWILLGALILLAGCRQAPPPQVDPIDPADRTEDEGIAAIEGAIVPLIQVEGREPVPMTLTERMRELDVPAVSAAVVRDGRIAWARAWGMADPEEMVPATPETLFQAASISKPVVATGALLLVEEGLLELDGPINAHLSSWRLPEHEWSASSPVTLRHLLTHTGGLTVHGFPGYDPGAPRPRLDQILDGAPPANTGPVRVEDEPGSRWRYSGGGTTIVQLAMDEVNDEPFHRWMARRVLGPAGMTSSTYEQPLPDSLRHRAAVAHLGDGTPVPGGWHVYPEQAAAGLWTTPSDLARWVVSVQRSASGGSDGGEAVAALLRPETARTMLTPGDGGWGLGPVLSGEGKALRFSHGGANRGFRAQVTGWVEGGRGIAVMTNSDRGGVVAQELLLAIATEYGWEGVEPRILTPFPVPETGLAAYTGRYELAEPPVTVTVRLVEGALWLTVLDGAPQELVPTGPDTFTDLVNGQSGTFERGDQGRVEVLVMGGARLERVDG